MDKPTQPAANIPGVSAKFAGLLVAGVVLSGCEETPPFVRFDRGEIVQPKSIVRSESDRCVVFIMMGQRTYTARLRESACKD